MKTISKDYSIHELVTFKIVDKTNLLNRLFSDINMEYANFELEKDNPNPDITILLQKFTPSLQGCYILDDKYYVRENYLYCKDSYKQAKWEFDMSGFESAKLIVRISNNLPGGMFISGNVIDPLIHFKMTNKGYSIVHASCVSKDHNAYLFSARSGGGKTTIALNLVEKGFNFLGDNFVILHNGYVLSYLSPLNIFSYNLLPAVQRKLGIKKRSTLQLKILLYKVTSGYIKIFTKVNPRKVFSDSITHRAKLKSVFLLMPKNEFHVQRISKQEMIEHLVLNQKLDSLYFIKYVTEYSSIFSESNFAAHWNRYKENLRLNLPENIPFYKVEVPQKYNERVFEKISRLVEKA